jgi:hypothetical protein
MNAGESRQTRLHDCSTLQQGALSVMFINGYGVPRFATIRGTLAKQQKTSRYDRGFCLVTNYLAQIYLRVAVTIVLACIQAKVVKAR